MIKCIIIDDEEPARELLGFFLKKLSNVEVVGDFKNPLDAIPLIESKTIDLVYLDIQMNEINGIDFIKSLTHKPKIILTTAYRDYAVDGFELEVADYLLKPFDFNRFLKSHNKVVAQLQTSTSSMNEQTSIILKEGKNKHKINLEDIHYIESENEYVAYHTNERKILVLDSLKNVERDLPSDQFLRVHRSFIVNVNSITSISADSKITIQNREIPVSSTYKKQVQNLF